MSSPENPFGAPQRAHQPAIEFRAGPTVPYASANGRARAANLLIIACGLTFVLMIVSTWLQIQLLEKARNGVRPTIEQATANDNRQVIVAGIYLLVFLVSVVTFCIWKHRVHRNLRSLGARHLKFSPGWAVGSYFIPILNLFRPCQIMNEINDNSLPSTTDGNKFGAVRATLAPVGAWWTFWILFNVSSNFASRLPGTDLDGLIFGSYMLIGSSVFGIIAAIACSFVILTITKNQELKHEQNSGTGMLDPGLSDIGIQMVRRAE